MAAGWGKLVAGTAATLAALLTIFVAPALAPDSNHTTSYKQRAAGIPWSPTGRH